MEMQTDAPRTGKVLYRKGNKKTKGWVVELPCKTKVMVDVDGGMILDRGSFRPPGPSEKRPWPMQQDTLVLLSQIDKSGEMPVVSTWAIRSRSVEM